MNPIEAKRFAELAHAGHTYGDNIPYSVHLENVVNVLKRFGFNSPEMECSGWLHDTLEDTKTSYNDLKKKFGVEIAENVFIVTDEKGRNRQERSEKTYPLINTRLKSKILKLADRIANVEWGMANSGKNEMYQKEYAKFKTYLYNESELEIQAMWNYLDTLLK